MTRLLSIHEKRGKNGQRRKERGDMGLTPTEKTVKARLMKQFVRLEGPSGNSEAYKSSAVWCDHPGCKRTNGTHVHFEMSDLNKQLEDMGRESYEAAVRASNKR